MPYKRKMLMESSIMYCSNLKKILIIMILLIGNISFIHSDEDHQYKERFLQMIDSARELNNENKIEESISKYDEAITFAEKSGLNKILQKYYLEIANLCFDNLRNEKAISYYSKCLSITDKEKDNVILNCLNSLGAANIKIGEYEKAIAYLLEALQLIDTPKTQLHSKILNGLGVVHIKISDHETALRYLSSALALIPASEISSTKAYLLNNIGICYHNLDKNEKAADNYNRAIAIWRKIEDKKGLGMTYSNLSTIFKEAGNNQQAIEYLKKSLEYKKNEKSSESIIFSFLNLGEIYIQSENLEEAEFYLKQALLKAKKSDNLDLKKSAFLLMARFYEAQKNDEQALKQYKKYIEIKDSLLNKTISKQIRELQIKYNSEQQKQEIERFKLEQEKNRLIRTRLILIIILIILILLFYYYQFRTKKKTNQKLEKEINIKTADLMKTNIELEKEIAERKKMQAELIKSERLAAIGEMASIVAHEIRNPITALRSTAQFCENNFTSISENKMKKMMNIFTETTDRVGKILKDLLDYSKPEPKNFIVIDLVDLLKKNISMVEDKCQKNEIDICLNTNRANIKAKINVEQFNGAILNLLLNAIEAIEKKGKLQINLIEKKSKIILEIEDNGCGIDQKLLDKVFQPFFTTKSTGSGLGLAYVQKIVNFHNGEIRIFSKKNKGTKFQIILGGENE